VLEDGAHLRLYFLQAPRFGAAAAAGGGIAGAAAPSAFGTAGGPALTGAAAEFADLQGILDPSAIAATDPAVLEAYRAVLGEQASPSRLAPSIHIIRIRDVAGGEGADVAEPAEGAEVDAAHLVVAFKTGSAHSLFSGLSAVYRWYGFFAVVKQVEVTSTGITVRASEPMPCFSLSLCVCVCVCVSVCLCVCVPVAALCRAVLCRVWV
jgi:hypothetical protein